MPYQVYIETFGCQMNEYDTELVRSLLTKTGFTFTGDQNQADVVLMNTCAIRENAHNRVYGHLGDCRVMKRERKVVVGVLGCMAQNLKKELMETDPVIDVLVGPDAYRQLPELLTRALVQQEKSLAVDLSEYETYEYILPERRPGVNGWIAVMRGCDNFCSFCVVPYTRGRERSRIPEGILEEARGLVSQGYKQITLLGQNVNSYASAGWDFARLLTAVADIPGIERVRFTSPHPKDFPPSLLEAVAQHPRVCRHIHLPLQAGNDRILELMGRCYTRKDFLALVDDIRRHGDISLSTDVICGFCSETDAEYQETYDLVKEVEFQAAYIFKYSERKHTIASRKYPDDVPDQVKTDRVKELIEFQKSVSTKLNQCLIGKTVEVLIEGPAKKSAGQWMGHTESNVTVVWQKPDFPTKPGDLVPVTVAEASASTLFGQRVPTPPSLVCSE
ncbi:tRNA (N6-isopentenyl adenosine(37)-C2)-methylthiotransferase MiaB [Candidatus Nitronereus thalassa]|uniref:tRNA-2-methylthio-N(6)-dimethylallyladenosine synthase n=1 Tax=Candidatus Nitronereus thalassa TaxID=3020898 RepID=A0ABU3KAK6_9BACT|nr:tRNA (N6-isopentenyl adenosine(37)-C2)-methylthiotransferase MiaB [Candidatus Nitronereus thalassa]MDT7043441.1 tRNA (N6-isopentenyl adenosine(37)-C2)-methylthiotransferase MiaB [Candidatus Nitronereus thalassa]